MAKIIDSDIESRTINSSYSTWKNTLVGLTVGVVFWCLTTFIGRFSNSVTIPGDVATILAATVGIILMVFFHMTRPLLVASASAASLWGLAQLTNGLAWFEVIIWTILLYGLAYALFSWVSRYTRIVPVLIVIIAIIVVVRIVATL